MSMSQDQACAYCKKTGSDFAARCGHFYHRTCYKSFSYYEKKCYECRTQMSSLFEEEELFYKIKMIPMDISKTNEQLTKIFGSFMKRAKMEYDGDDLVQLMKFGWDINNENLGGPDQFYIASEYNDIKKLDLFIEYGIDYEKYGSKALECSIRNSSTLTFERLINLGIPLEPEFIFKSINCYKGTGMLKRLIELGADVNCSIDYRATRPVHMAAMNGSVDHMNVLMENGADWNVTDKEGYSIFHHACDRNEGYKFMEKFQDSGYNFDCQNRCKRTPLMLAVRNNNMKCFEFLLSQKIDLNIKDYEGNTALHLCISSRHVLTFMERLIASGANVNAQNFKKETPLHLACYLDYSIRDEVFDNVVTFLLDNGADIHMKDKYKRTPLSFLVHKLSRDLKKRFIDAGADLTCKSYARRGKTIWDVIASSKDSDLVIKDEGIVLKSGKKVERD